MMLNLLDKIGDWNPQLLRELKGRLKSRNILLAIAISLLGQFLIFMVCQIELPTRNTVFQGYSNKYCTGEMLYNLPKCIKDEFGNVVVNWQLWSLDLFTHLSIIGTFTLLVAGTYLLISDLASEERRETLNFIRLSPQSHQSIFSGKILGVPILLYVVVLLAVPLHLWSALNAKISLQLILSFYAAVVAASILYYSGALLFGLVSSWLGGFQAWLGSGVVLGFLLISLRLVMPEISDDYPLVFLRLVNPCYLIPNADMSSVFRPISSRLTNFHWFALPLGDSVVNTLGFALSIYGIGTYFIWQSLQRCFRDPNTTMLSKQQSYLLTACFTVITLGCANWQKLAFDDSPGSYLLAENIVCLFFLNFWLLLYLIAALNPHRQILQDWARYKRTSTSKGLVNSTLFQNLIWGEKSPGLVAIAINAMIAIIGLCGLIFLSRVPLDNKINAIFALALAGSLAMIYAALAQLLLFSKNKHRVFWTNATIAAVIVLPVIIMAIFSSYSRDNNFLWLFSILAPIYAISPEANSLSPIKAFLAILVHWSTLGLLVFQLRRNLRKAGESATKALLAS
ncbi:MAG: hypothetical protein KME32_18975 [Mojavia pulchra JT2-VF2]|jgi:hypothetical protein|uniref:Uncharacterized protein n=1 Tax=Mojavia pulchra JT2-VF2 TaxID=287848 RepID=A0A951Q1I0_9NOST|nr:hypothetical protein [Mojavia pulchra JT2-VF2]